MKNNEFKNFIIKLAREAGKIIKKKFRNTEYVKFKDEFGDPVTDADYASEHYVISKIKKQFPRHKILSEEGGVDGSDHGDYLWIIDPLDGTGNFAMGIPIFCVSIALSYKKEIILGAIYDPIHNELFWGERGRGAFLNGKRIHISQLTKPNHSRIIISWHDPEDFKGVDEKLLKSGFRKWRFIGSAALSFAYFAAGRGDVYLSANNKLWDVAAGFIIAKEAGAKLTDFDGGQWNFDSKNLMGANKILRKKLLTAIK